MRVIGCRLLYRSLERCLTAVVFLLVVAGLSSAQAQIAANATSSLAAAADPSTALGRLAAAVNNSSELCGLKEGWDIACLRAKYRKTPEHWPQPTIDAGKDWQEWGPVPAVPEPADSKEQAKRLLGQALFFDPGLSKKGKVACASCHQADKSFGDGLALSVGEDRMMGRRRSMPLFAAPFAEHLFWDGRAASLQAQAKDSIRNPFEMNNTLQAAVDYVRDQSNYREWLQEAYGHSDISVDEMVDAIASFVRTIRPPTTLADMVIAGGASHLNDQQLLGMHLFRTKARCMNCHSGPLLTDHEFHDLGLSFYGRRNQDLGRFEATRNREDLGKFRTPSLRGLAHAGPWMHNGLFPDLPGLIRLYNIGMGNVAGDIKQDPYIPIKSPHINSLHLNATEIDALIEWLRIL